jgi:hypothetical protein
MCRSGDAGVSPRASPGREGSTSVTDATPTEYGGSDTGGGEADAGAAASVVLGTVAGTVVGTVLTIVGMVAGIPRAGAARTAAVDDEADPPWNTAHAPPASAATATATTTAMVTRERVVPVTT